MISKYEARSIPMDAPGIIHELRNAFDARLMELNTVAQEKFPTAPAGQGHDHSVMHHIDFPHGYLQVTAVYNASEDRFTQLIARLAEEAHHERPSFTISLFL